MLMWSRTSDSEDRRLEIVESMISIGQRKYYIRSSSFDLDYQLEFS